MSSHHPRPLQLMSSMCEDYSSLRTYFAILSLKGKSLSVFHKKAILLIEYIQILSPILLSTLFFASSNETLLPNIFNYAAKFLNPSYWILSDSLNSFHAVILGLCFGFFILKNALLSYILFVSHRRMKAQPLLLEIWKYVFKVQGRVVFSFIATIWANTIILIKAGDSHEVLGETVKVLAVIVITSEFLISFICFQRYEDILPLKHFLSAKNANIELLTLFQKLVLLILIIFLPKYSLTSLWVYASLNLAFDLIRNIYFFKKLPLYSFKALYYQRILLMAVSSLNIAVLIACIAYYIDDTTRCLPILIFLWAIIFILGFKVSGAYLERRFVSLVSDTGINIPHLLIHRLVAIKELRKITKMSSEHDERNTWEYLLLKTVNSNLHKIFEIDSVDIKPSNSSELNEMFRGYLERLLQKYPKDNLIKLYTARFYTKKFNLYGDAIRISRNLILKDTISETIKLNAELLLFDLENAMKLHFSSQEKSSLDLRQYISELALLAQAKELMVQQTDLQIQICTEIKKELSDLELILRKSQKLESLRKKATSHMKQMLSNISDYHLEPFALCAQYHLTLNHSINEYIRFCKEISLRSQKYKESFEENAFLQENVFQENVGHYLVSCNENNAGSILYVNISTQKIVGRDYQSLVGQNVVLYAPPCLRSFYSTFYTPQAEKMFKDAYGVIARSFHYHSQGYLMEIDYYVHVHPFLTHGFCFSLLVKPIISDKDFMFVYENGDIDSVTRGIGEQLGILSVGDRGASLGNIREISEELGKANEAFNMMREGIPPAAADKKRKSVKTFLTLGEAKEIEAQYTTTGKDVQLWKSGSEGEEGYSYNCKIANMSFGPIQIKLFTFQKKKEREIDPRMSPKMTSIIQQGDQQQLQTLDIIVENSKYSDEFGDIDEKVQATKDSKDLTTTRDYTHRTSTRLLTGTERERATARNFSSTLCPQDPLDSGIRFSLPPPMMTASKVISIPKFSQSTGAKNTKFAQKEKPVGSGRGNKFGTKSSLNTSNWSRFAYKKKMFNLYKSSLETPFVPGFFRIVSGIFYSFFFVALFAEVLLKVSLEKDLHALTRKKDILRNSEARDNILVRAQSTIRVFRDLIEGELDPLAFGSQAYLLPTYEASVNIFLDSLGEINRVLVEDTAQLEEEIKNFVFENDVKIYDNYFGESPDVFLELDNFQALDRIIETGLKIVDFSAVVHSSQFTEATNFLFRNMLNDILIKNQKISQKILTSLDDQHEHSQMKISIYLGGCVFIFGSLLLIFFAVLWRQYRQEVGHISALCRLDQGKLDIVLRSFHGFRFQLENQDFNNSNLHDIHLYLNRFNKTEKGNNEKRDYVKEMNLRGIVKRYYFYLVKLCIPILIMFAIFLTNSLFNQSAVESFKTRQTQIYFADHAQTRTVLSFVAARELYSTNNTAQVENFPAKTELQILLQTLIIIKEEIYEIVNHLPESDLAETVNTIIFGDSCAFFDSSFDFYCQTLKAKGQRTGFIYLADSIEFILENQLRVYEESDKSAAVLKELREDNLELLASLFVIANEAAGKAANLVDRSFENRATEVARETLIITIVSIMMMGIVGVLLRSLLLEELKNGITRGKNVLKVLPPELVLSSFILKSFLVRTSKGLLETIKHEI